MKAMLRVVVVKAEARPAPVIELIAGPGIGTVTRGGLQVEVRGLP